MKYGDDGSSNYLFIYFCVQIKDLRKEVSSKVQELGGTYRYSYVAEEVRRLIVNVLEWKILKSSG